MSHTGPSFLVTTKLSVVNCQLPLHQWRLLGHLTGLTELRIEGCGDLTGTPEIIRHLSSLTVLYLTAKEHEDLPKWLGELTSLGRLYIVGYAGLKELDENMRKLTKLQELHLGRCNSMSSLPCWLIELTCLKILVISRSEGIGSLPEGVQQLTNLQKLVIFECPQLERWCESEENEMNLAHIEDRVCTAFFFQDISIDFIMFRFHDGVSV